MTEINQVHYVLLVVVYLILCLFCCVLTLKLCMGLSWIGSCGLSFYVGNMYGKGELMNL